MANLEHVNLLCDGVSAWNAHRARYDFVPDLTHLEMRGVDLSGASLQGTDFDGSVLTRVDFRAADLDRARLNGITGSRVSFQGAAMSGAEFKGTDFAHASFGNAQLNGTTWFRAKVRHCDLRAAILTCADLRFVHLYNSDFVGARLDGSTFDQVDLKRPRIEAPMAARLREAGCAIELENQPTTAQWLDREKFSARGGEEEFGLIIAKDSGQAYWMREGRWDFFISHGSADKADLVIPLKAALEARGQRVWLDDGQIDASDSLSGRIGFGIQCSLFGIVVLSREFFGRLWTTWELERFLGGAEREELEPLNHKRIFLVLQGLTIEEVAKLRPELADRYALSAVLGAERIAEKLIPRSAQRRGEPSERRRQRD